MKKKKKLRKVKKRGKKTFKRQKIKIRKKQKKIKRKSRRKVRSAKISSKKPYFKNLLTLPKIQIKFSFKDFLKKMVSPITNRIIIFKKNKAKEELRKAREIEKQRKIQSSLRQELLKKEIKEEKELARKRTEELKSFIKEEQIAIREKEKEKQRKFLEEVKLEKTLESFRKRELEEIKAIEKYTLNIEKEDYKDFQHRIDQVREKYKALRNERLRRRVEDLGVTLSDQASVEEIRKKEKEYLQRRELISISIESFRRSAHSLIYQISRRHLPKNADLIRCVDNIELESEIIIKEDQAPLNEYLVLIALKDNDYEKGIIIVEDKITQTTREYNKNQIFKFGDDLTDSIGMSQKRLII